MTDTRWTDDLSVGVALIDDQHRMMIDRLNELRRAVETHEGPNKIANTLTFLIEYADLHFSTEEKHMGETGYPGLQDQVSQHGEFKKTLADLEQDYREEGPTHELAQSIDTLLLNWLIKHIRGTDQRFGDFLRENNITITGDDDTQ